MTDTPVTSSSEFTISETARALQAFQQRWLETYQDKHGTLPEIEQDADWPSPCEQGQAGDNNVYWQPVPCPDELSFANVEQALKLELHPDYKTLFTRSYSNHLPANCDDGWLELLQTWSCDDFQRLQENLIGHIMMKRKRKQPETLFFAVTDNDEILLSIVNQTGEVWAERAGQEPHRRIATSVSEFLNQLKPVVD